MRDGLRPGNACSGGMGGSEVSEECCESSAGRGKNAARKEGGRDRADGERARRRREGRAEGKVRRSDAVLDGVSRKNMGTRAVRPRGRPERKNDGAPLRFDQIQSNSSKFSRMQANLIKFKQIRADAFKLK